MTTKFAVIGAGRMGQTHARAVAQVEGTAVVAVYDALPAAAQAFQAAFGAEPRSVEDIAAARDVDAVIICSPTDTHADMIEVFAAAGKAVFCEKPIHLDLARVKACLKTVEASGQPLMVGFNRRFDPDFRAAKAAIDAGQIGTVEMVTILSRDPEAPPYDYITRSGGIFRDMTIHDFDLARWLLGAEIETVLATAATLTDPKLAELGDYDSVNIILRTASGTQATITNSRRAAFGYDQRWEVLGSKGMVQAGNHHQTSATLATAEGFQTAPLKHFFMDRYMPAYTAEITAFCAALANGTPMPATGHDGLMALALADCANLSVEQGRAVHLSEVL